MAYLFSIFLLTCLYLLITGEFSLVSLTYGVILATFITLLLRPAELKPNWRRLPGALWGLFRYVWLLIYDMTLAGVQIARIVLDPKLPIRPGMVEIPAECQSDLAIALSIHALTLTPGELVVRLDERNILQVHLLNTSHSVEKVKEAHHLREDLLRDIFI